jgi:RHS repeat-associated protein
MLKSTQTQFSYGVIQEDVLGTASLALNSTDISISTDAESVVVDAGFGYSFKRLYLPLRSIDSSWVREETLQVFTAEYNNAQSWTQVADAQITVEEDGITIELPSPVFGRYIKLHSTVHHLDQNGQALRLDTLLEVDTSQVVLTALAGGRNEFYSYRPDGNRVGKTILAGNITSEEYRYYPNSDLVQISGTTAYRYDENGNLIEKGTSFTQSGDQITIELPDDQSGEYWLYEWDLLNRLVKVETWDAQTQSLVTAAEYGYDINNYRIYKRDREGSSHYVFDQMGNRLEEHRIEDETTSSSFYVFRNGRHVARRDSDGEILFYATDHLGSTVMVTDRAGQIKWQGESAPFGDSVSESGELAGSEGLKYTGKDFDEDIGLYYFNARWYDAHTARFVSEDPAKDGGNWYAYVGNNPTSFIDPSGLFREWWNMSDEEIEGYREEDRSRRQEERDRLINISNEEILEIKFEEWNLNLANDLNTALAEQDAILDLIRQIDPIAYADMMVMLRYGGNPEFLLEGEALHLFDQYTAVTAMIAVLQQTTNGVPEAYSWMQQQGTAGRSVSEADFLATAYHDGGVKNTVQQIEQLALAVYAGSQYGGNKGWVRRVQRRLQSTLNRLRFSNRQLRMIADDVGYNVSPESWFRRYDSIGPDGTFITDRRAIINILGDDFQLGPQNLTNSQSTALERAMGLTPGSLGNGVRITEVRGISTMNPRSPLIGNSFFRGPGMGLPGGGPEMIINSIPTGR